MQLDRGSYVLFARNYAAHLGLVFHLGYLCLWHGSSILLA